ncbi:MAG: hypothetical protein IPK93_02980 [Solirubrobacterales bacterium]|nr:hypothetical protein [Solirubrobacterales bacterium]
MADQSDPSLVQKVTLAHQALTDAGIKHAFGGALALAYYGEPRVTIDIDLNVFVGVDQINKVLGVFASQGAGDTVDRGSAERDEQVRIWWGRNPVDLFFSYDPFHDAMERSARLVTFDDGRIPILSPEHLIVCKVVFNRSKDWVDIEQILLGEGILEKSEIFDWLNRILGTGDTRLERTTGLWERLR